MRFSLLSVLLLAGCPTDPCKPGRDPTLEIGVGLDRFHDAPEGSNVPLVYGVQGGFHIDLALRATGLDTSDFVSGELSGLVGGIEVAYAQPWIQFECTEEGQVTVGQRLIYDATPTDLDGQTTAITVRLQDQRGERVEATTELVIVDIFADE